MAETIREHLIRRIRRLGAVGICGWLLFVVVPFVAADHKDPPVPLIITGFVLFGGAILLIQRVKCPKCSTILGQLAVPLAFTFSQKRKINFCPYCGTSLDEPLPQKLIS
jgi:hypothetical protein